MQSGSTPQIRDYFSDLNTPNVDDQKLQLQQLVQQGVLTPEQAATITLDPSAMAQITTDPNLQKNQMDALLGLQEVANDGGMTTMDKANLQGIQNNEAATAKGNRDSIIQNAEQRGMGGSGLSLLDQLTNAQDSATRRSQQDLTVAGTAQARALQALQDAGTQSGQMQQTQFNQAAQKATAQDAISKFNATNAQNQINQNVATANDAAAKNLAAKQSVADQNTGIANQQQQYNKALTQQQYEDEIQKRSGQAGISTNNAANAGKDSQGAANATNQTIGTGLSTAALIASDERCKENIESFDPADFLDSLTGYKFDYKDKRNGQGKQAGVMAQDLEKTDEGSKLVVDTPEGKFVDYSKSGPVMMASIANINDRLRAMEGRDK